MSEATASADGRKLALFLVNEDWTIGEFVKRFNRCAGPPKIRYAVVYRWIHGWRFARWKCARRIVEMMRQRGYKRDQMPELAPGALDPWRKPCYRTDHRKWAREHGDADIARPGGLTTQRRQ